MVGPASLVDSLRELLVDDPVLDSAALVGKLLELHPDLRTSVSEAALTTLVESELSFQAMCRSNAIGQRDLAEARQAGLSLQRKATPRKTQVRRGGWQGCVGLSRREQRRRSLSRAVQ